VMPAGHGGALRSADYIPYIIVFGLTVSVYGWRLISKLLDVPLRQLSRRSPGGSGDLAARVEAGRGQ